MKTKVVFRKFKEGQIIALFPENIEGNYKISSYMRIGQHACADYYSIISITKPCNPAEYSSLKKELESNKGKTIHRN